MLTGVNTGYGFVLGTFFYFTGLSSQTAAAALSGFCGAMTTVFAYRISRICFSEWVAVRTGWWVCFFPGMVIWSALSIKEPILILMEQAILYGCLQLQLKRTAIRHIALCGFSFLVLLSLRFYAAYLAAMVVLISLFLSQFGGKKLTVIPALGVSVVLLGPIYLMSGSLTAHTEAIESRADIKEVQRFKQAVSTGGAMMGAGSGVSDQFDMETSTGFGLGTLFGAAHLLLAPFPWQLLRGASVRMILTLPEILAWYYLFFRGVIPGLWSLIRTRLGDVMPLLLFMLGLGLIYSIMFANIGLVYRQRAQLLPYLFAIGFYGIERRRLRKMEKARRREMVSPWPAFEPTPFPAPEGLRWRH